jgi:hypothetical protein
LDYVLRYGEKWDLIKDKLRHFNFTDAQYQENFLKLFYYVNTDVLSAIHHAKQEGLEKKYREDRYLSTLLDQVEFGSFCSSWTETEIRRVITTMSTFLFSITKIGEEKISPEFSALCCLSSKNYQQFKEFTQSFLAELYSGGQNGQIVLRADIHSYRCFFS